MSNGLMAVAAFSGSQRLTEWARSRAQRASTAHEGAVAGYGSGPALPSAESLAMLPPPMPPQPVYVQPPSVDRANRALAEAVRLTSQAQRD